MRDSNRQIETADDLPSQLPQTASQRKPGQVCKGSPKLTGGYRLRLAQALSWLVAFFATQRYGPAGLKGMHRIFGLER